MRIAALPGGEPPTLRRAAGGSQYEDFVVFGADEAEGRLELQGLRIETPDGWAAVYCCGAHCRAELRDCTLSGRGRAVRAFSGAKVRVEGGALRGCRETAYGAAFAPYDGSEVLVRAPPRCGSAAAPSCAPRRSAERARALCLRVGRACSR